MRVFLYTPVVVILAGISYADKDYESFIESLSYNWQNVYPGIRNQVHALENNDPQKYQLLAMEMGLKANGEIKVPSLYDETWVSKFVSAADLYTPPPSPSSLSRTSAASAEPIDHGTELEINVPTHSFDKSHKSSNESSDDDDDGEEESNYDDDGDDDANDRENSTSHSKNSKDKNHSSKNSDDDYDDNDNDESSGHEESENSLSFGNPIVTNLDFQTVRVRPTGVGYSGAPLATTVPCTLLAYALILNLLL